MPKFNLETKVHVAATNGHSGCVGPGEVEVSEPFAKELMKMGIMPCEDKPKRARKPAADKAE